MSPEQLRGKAVDHRSDIFSFGAIFYEMLTGKRAFAGETQVDTMTAILKEDPPEMIREGQDIPAAFEQVVRHCLEKEPENRFQSARDLAFALSTLSDVTTGRQDPSVPPGGDAVSDLGAAHRGRIAAGGGGHLPGSPTQAGAQSRNSGALPLSAARCTPLASLQTEGP